MSKKILILNGPNLNLVGQREPGIYGSQSFEAFLPGLKAAYPAVEISYYQSNIEGELINAIHNAQGSYDYIIINAGGYAHTSVAIADAIAAVKVPTVEVHISNIYAREEYRHQLLIAPRCIGVISGFGLQSYKLAVEYIVNNEQWTITIARH